jgi:hypothetical protein
MPLKTKGREPVMFSAIKKMLSREYDGSKDRFDRSKVRTFYEGEVICGDYNLNDPSIYPYHNLFPDGHGKLVYSIDGKVVEQYEGFFDAGQYHGPGTRIDADGEVFSGLFERGEFKPL